MGRYHPTNRHHLRNRSRFPPDALKEEMDNDNVVELDVDFHSAWHYCFKNLSPEEAIEFIKLVMRPDTYWTRHDLARARFHIMNRQKF